MAKGKMVMTAISEEVKWRGDRDQIVRYADETLALQHPTVVKRMKELKTANYELKMQLSKEQDYFARLLNIANFHFWNLPKLKSLLRERGTQTGTNQ